MDPVRGVIHLSLKLTEATLDRALDVVRLADTLVVASAVPPVYEPAPDETVWPQEEQADLDALSATLRARKDPQSAPAPTEAKKSSAKKSAPAKKSAAKKSAPAKKSAARKSAAKKSAPAKKSTAKKSTAKKSTAKKTAAKKSAASPDA